MQVKPDQNIIYTLEMCSEDYLWVIANITRVHLGNVSSVTYIS